MQGEIFKADGEVVCGIVRSTSPAYNVGLDVIVPGEIWLSHSPRAHTKIMRCKMALDFQVLMIVTFTVNRQVDFRGYPGLLQLPGERQGSRSKA